MRTISTGILILVLLLFAAFRSAASGESAGRPDMFIIDVRSEEEWKVSHIEGAVLIPHDRVAAEISRLTVDKKAHLVLYCRSGRRTAIAADALKKSGYVNLTNLGSMENAARVLEKRIVR